MTTNDVIVTMRGISKWFRKKQALDGIDLEITRGKIIGLLGANGAGKSTLLRHIIGLYLPNKGGCVTFGKEAAKLGPRELARIGYVHQEGELLDWMKVKQLIRYVSAYYESWSTELEEKYIRDFEISLNERVGTLSPGQRQKLAILLAIGFEPELLILDEPAAALDPIARSNFLDLLLQFIQNRERTIIISSHILSDIEKVIDHAVIMDKGRIIRDCSFDDLRSEFIRFTLTSLDGPLPDSLPFENIIACERADLRAVVTVRSISQEALETQAREIHCDIDIKPLPLEDIYKLVIRQETGK